MHPEISYQKQLKWFELWYKDTDCFENIRQCLIRLDIDAAAEYVGFLCENPEKAAGMNKQDQFGMSILMHCARDGCHEIMKLVLQIPGVDVNLADNYYHHTALMWVAKCGHTQCVDTRSVWTHS
jgi:ankyrin repeat protein